MLMQNAERRVFVLVHPHFDKASRVKLAHYVIASKLAHFKRRTRTTVKDEIAKCLQPAVDGSVDQHHLFTELNYCVFTKLRKVFDRSRSRAERHRQNKQAARPQKPERVVESAL